MLSISSLDSIIWWDFENLQLPHRVDISTVFPLINDELKDLDFKSPLAINAIASMKKRLGKNLLSLLKSHKEVKISLIDYSQPRT